MERPIRSFENGGDGQDTVTLLPQTAQPTTITLEIGRAYYACFKPLSDGASSIFTLQILLE